MGLLDGYDTYDTREGFGSSNEWRGQFYERIGEEEAEEILGSQSPYEVLGVPTTATPDQIKSAFRKLIMKHHPDRNNGSKESEAKTKLIVSAYTILTA